MTMAPTNAGNGWLGRWVDTSLRIPGDLDPERISAEEIERLLTDLAIVLYASQIPRRLGGDALSEELAEDKRRCRRVGWALRQSLRQWTPNVELPNPVPEYLRQAGAQLEWTVYGEQHSAVLTERTKRAATWAALNGEKKWGATIVTCLENERRWVIHALR